MSDDRTELPEADPQVAADEGVEMPGAEAEPTPEPAPDPEYIEYVGVPPYGVEFIDSHIVSRNDLKPHNIDLGTKEVRWTKRGDGRMLVPVDQMTPQAADLLANDPMFRRVKLSS